MWKNVFLMVFAVSAVFFITSVTVEAEEDECAKVFKMNCAECHGIERGCELLGQSKDDWVELFDYMADMGADIPEDELNLLSECLVNPSEAVKKVCE